MNEVTLLVAEDEPVIRSIFDAWFQQAGYRVLTAENGLQALELLQQNAIDLIISDVRMPVMDGISLVRRMKEEHRYFPKILFISGFTDISKRDSYDLGVEMSLPKPVRRKALLEAVRKCLANMPDRWSVPPETAAANVLHGQFDSLPAAQKAGLIAFGRGGFCVRNPLRARTDDPIGLDLHFAAEGRAIIGQGIVRWCAVTEEEVGVEIAFIEPAQLEWISDVCARNETNSFIPRTSRGE